MNSIHRTRLPSTEDQLRLDLLEWREITLAHSKTEGIAAPFPKYEILYFLEDNFMVIDDPVDVAEQLDIVSQLD
jgi:hypothetical protein